VFRKAIVVGVDGSSESLRAAAVARRIADAAGERVRLQIMHAVPEARLAKAVGPVPVYVSGLFAQALADTRRELTGRLRGVVPPAALKTLDVRAGRAAQVLADTVARRGAGLVVLGGKRHGRLARTVRGSTAHYLARVLDIPILVTAAGGLDLKRVLVAVDLSTAAGRTLATGVALARALGARVRVLHVLEPIRYAYVVLRAPDAKAAFERSRATLRRLVARYGIAETDTVVRRGAAVDTIVAEAGEWRADLIVVGSQGKGFVDRLLIGSTTESLLELLPASLLIVPAARGKTRGLRARR
jgi:nucleotide-binding universal stress UspA family protein